MAAELPPARIDRSSPVPFYSQLTDVLRREIGSRNWPPGERVPSESQLCDHFEVSRTTVRQALDELERDGLIRREKGRGTFVAERSASTFLQSTAGFFEEATSHGHTVRSRVLRRDIGALPEHATAALGLRPGTEGLLLERLRFLDEEPVMYARNYLPRRYADAVLEEPDLEHRSLYRILREAYGLEVGGGRRTIHAEVADDDVAELLSVDPGTPLLILESVSWDTEEIPFEAYLGWHVSDRARVEVQIVREPEAER